MPPSMHILDGSVVVTGASRGIGLGVACLLATHGVRVALVARDPQRLARVHEVLSSRGAHCVHAAADVTDPRPMDEAFRTAERLGLMAAVVHSAGVIDPIAPLVEVNPAQFTEHLRTNVTGSLIATQLAHKYHRGPDTLRVVHVSSGAAVHAYQGWAAYCSSKAALNMLTEVAASELAPARVSVVAVAPGVVETDMQKHLRSLGADQFPQVDRFHHLHQSGQLLDPVDAAAAIVWLASRAPESWSGRFVDARSEDVMAAVQRAGDWELDRARELYRASTM